MSVKVILCEDETESVHKFRTLLRDYENKHQINIEFIFYLSGEELLQSWVTNKVTADVIYLDILMDKLNGMETARALRKAGCKAHIVFLTVCKEFVYQAFDVGAKQYLLKENLTEEQFDRVLSRTLQLPEEPPTGLYICEFAGKKTPVPFEEITYIEILSRVVTIHYGDESVKFYKRLDELEQELSPYNIVRCHRSYLVSISAIAEFRRNEITLKTGDKIPLSKTYYSTLINIFSKYMDVGESGEQGEPPCVM